MIGLVSEIILVLDFLEFSQYSFAFIVVLASSYPS